MPWHRELSDRSQGLLNVKSCDVIHPQPGLRLAIPPCLKAHAFEKKNE